MLRTHPIRVLLGTAAAAVVCFFLSYPGGNDMVNGEIVPRSTGLLAVIGGILYFLSLALVLAFIVMAVMVTVRKIAGRRTAAVGT